MQKGKFHPKVVVSMNHMPVLGTSPNKGQDKIFSQKEVKRLEGGPNQITIMLRGR